MALFPSIHRPRERTVTASHSKSRQVTTAGHGTQNARSRRRDGGGGGGGLGGTRSEARRLPRVTRHGMARGHVCHAAHISVVFHVNVGIARHGMARGHVGREGAKQQHATRCLPAADLINEPLLPLTAPDLITNHYHLLQRPLRPAADPDGTWNPDEG